MSPGFSPASAAPYAPFAAVSEIDSTATQASAGTPRISARSSEAARSDADGSVRVLPSRSPAAPSPSERSDAERSDARPRSAPGLFRKAAVDARRAEAPEVDFLAGFKPKGWSVLLLLASLVGLLFVGASSPIRDLDLMVAKYEVGGRRKVIANRGLSGIDGTVSSAIGAALGRPRTSRAIALMGDVTFLHDANGLVLGPDEPRPDLTIVVVNDDGGSIFAMLEQGEPQHGHAFERLFGTPHGVDLASLCAATRTPHWRVDNLAELEHALASPNGGVEVVEAVVGRQDRRSLDERIRALTP